MDEFSYLSVLLSIIIGLAVTQVLQCFRGVLLSRARIRLYWPALAWAAILLLIYVQSWWAMFGLRRQETWTFGAFAIVLLHTVLLYMLAALVLPEFAPNESIDLRENYFAHHGWFFGTAVLTVLASLGKDLVLTGGLPNRTNVVFHLIFGGIAAVGAITRREWYHKLAVLTMAVLFVVYTVVLFEYLR